jgi:hypothetical protein
MSKAVVVARADYWQVLDPVWDHISIYDGADRFLREFEATAVAPRTLFAAHFCQSEICNGGFAQFFGNSTGVLAPEAVDAFRALGMPATADLVQRAVSAFGPEYPRERDSRDDRMEALFEAADPFQGMDAQLFELIKTENGGFVKAADAYAAAGPSPRSAPRDR